MHGRGHSADLFAVDADRPGLVIRSDQRLTIEFQTNLKLADAGIPDPGQRRLADKIRLHVEIDQPVHAKFERVVRQRHVGMVGQHRGFNPADAGSMAGVKPHRPANLHQILPQQIALAAVTEEDFVAKLARPAGPRNHQRHAVPVIFHEPVIFQLGRRVPEGGTQDIARTRPLKLQRRDIGFAHLDIHAGGGGHAARPEQHIAVGDRQPEMVLAKLQQDRIIDDAAVLVGDQHIFALSDLAAGQIAAAQELGKARRIRTGDLDLALHRHITEDGFIHKVPEILHRIAEIARNIHVVIDGKPLRTPAQRGIGKGRFANLRSKAEFAKTFGVG